jgi:glutamate N-acetyltransferase/amino-acid N-acetyltransferase
MKKPTRLVLPRGFRFAAAACGLKKNGRPDLALMACETPAAAAAVFTTNRVQAAPVLLSRAHLQQSRGRMRAVVVNSGNANCATGPAGYRAAQATARAAARALGCRAEEVLVCSTGVIGVPLRVGKILRALPQLERRAAATVQAFERVARAILTTDTRPKLAAATCRIGGKTVRLLGCAKGAGMIAPRMATMLALLVTDAAIAPRRLQRMLRAAVAETFNRITVDGDTSTNDTVAVLASGTSGAAPAGRRDADRFRSALTQLCRALALQIVADGEGARRVVEIEVRGAASAKAAERVARAIANSPLVKTALAGADPNWGRILAAAGRAGVDFDPARATIWLAGSKVFARGRPLPFDERAVRRRLLRNYVSITVDLGAQERNAKGGGQHPGSARVWTCDFTADYVRINAGYRS